MRTASIRSLVLAVVSAWHGSAWALSEIATEDTSVRQAHPDTNYGTLPLSVVADASAARESYLKFVVSDLPAGAIVTSAKVRLYVQSGGGVSNGPKIYLTPNTSWSELTMTWNTRPGATGAALDDLGAVFDLTSVELDVTSAVTANGTFSFTLLGDVDETFIADSREDNNPPELDIEYSTGTTFTATADTSVRQAHPDTNYGTLPLSVVADPTAARESYVEFVVSGLPSGATVTSAKVQLWVESGGGVSNGPKIYVTPTTSWGELTMTWNNQPGATGSALDDLGAAAELTWVSLDVTPAVTGNGTFSFTLIGDVATETLITDAREGTNPPQLVVAYALAECPTGIDRSVIQYGSETRPAAGGSYIDPQFGNKIIRVTGDGASQNGYSLWGEFSVDKTVNGHTLKNFHLLDSSSNGQLYTIDTGTDQVTYVGALFGTNSVGCDAEDAVWSHTPGQADVIYCHSTNAKILYSYNVGTGAFTTIKDFSQVSGVGSEVSLCQMGMDKNDNAFTFSTRPLSKCGGSDNARKAVAWDRTTGFTYVHDYSSTPIDETQMDKNGTYIVVRFPSDAAVDITKFRNGDSGLVHLADGAGNGYIDHGHSAPGSGIMVNEDGGNTGWEIRSFATPGSATNLMQILNSDGSQNWTTNGHISINQSDERYFLAELWVYPVPASLEPWEQEIVAVAMDGTWIKRLAHHHSVRTSYSSEPRVSISYDSKYALFTSNYDGLGQDVYILKLPTICN